MRYFVEGQPDERLFGHLRSIQRENSEAVILYNHLGATGPSVASSYDQTPVAGPIATATQLEQFVKAANVTNSVRAKLAEKGVNGCPPPLSPTLVQEGLRVYRDNIAAAVRRQTPPQPKP